MNDFIMWLPLIGPILLILWGIAIVVLLFILVLQGRRPKVKDVREGDKSAS